MRLKPVTIKLSEDLHESLSDYAQLTGEMIQEVVSAALQRELESRIRAGGAELATTLAKMRAFRRTKAA